MTTLKQQVSQLNIKLKDHERLAKALTLEIAQKNKAISELHDELVAAEKRNTSFNFAFQKLQKLYEDRQEYNSYEDVRELKAEMEGQRIQHGQDTVDLRDTIVKLATRLEAQDG